MILIDFSSVLHRTIHSLHAQKSLSEDFLRHSIITNILTIKKKFGMKYGSNIILCCDGRNYWRKDIFPQYKAARKIVRDKSKLDWDKIFKWVNPLMDDLIEYFPYKVIQVSGAEGDDVIAFYCKKYSSTEKVTLIVSEDKDLQQLQKYNNIHQWSALKKKMMRCQNPSDFLLEHILSGDAGDGVPNILSDDNCFVEKKRQTPMTKKKKDEFKLIGAKEFCSTSTLKKNFIRNKTMVDLDMVPEHVNININKAIEDTNDIIFDRKTLVKYFMDHKMKVLFDSINDF